MTDRTIALPEINIPDLHALTDANPDMAALVPDVGFCAYDHDTKTAWICFDETRQWTVVHPIEKDDFLRRIATVGAANRAGRPAPDRLN